MELDKGVIYAFIGVVGSGKSYRLEATKKAYEKYTTVPAVLTMDFSDGIRQTLMNIFLGHDSKVDVTSDYYAIWKEAQQTPLLPYKHLEHEALAYSRVTGRELLQRTGEYIKTFAGSDVWAKWSMNDVLKKIGTMTASEARDAVILAGSVRFVDEVAVLFELAERTEKELRFIFCDYHSKNYKILDHPSEALAQYLLGLGHTDGEDITERIKNLCDVD